MFEDSGLKTHLSMVFTMYACHLILIVQPNQIYFLHTPDIISLWLCDLRGVATLKLGKIHQNLNEAQSELQLFFYSFGV